MVGAFPTYVSIMQGQINFNAVMVQISAQEIVRCTCLAIRRRRELLGAASPHDALSAELVVKLAPRPAMPNHWSQAWVDAELGLTGVLARL